MKRITSIFIFSFLFFALNAQKYINKILEVTGTISSVKPACRQAGLQEIKVCG